MHNRPVNARDPFGLYDLNDLLRDSGNASSGALEGLLGPLSGYIRNNYSGGDLIDPCSTAYRIGWWAATALPFVVTGAEALAARAAARAAETVEAVEAVTEGTTALSPYRLTREGETFYHYGYAEHAGSFEGGLRPGGFATSVGDLSGAEAQSGLALPHANPPNAVYKITPEPGTWVRINPVTEPKFGQPGGLPEFEFPGGTGPGTVSSPMPIGAR